MGKSKLNPKALGGGNTPGPAKSNGAIFMVAALDMSWRLAITVLVPIIGGFEIDKAAGTAPALTIVGFLVAMAGLFLLLKSTLATADKRFNPKETRR